MEKTKLNLIKSGVLTIIAFMIVVCGIYVIGQVTSEPQQDVRFSFDFANSLDDGAPVRVSGVHAGKVVSVRLLTADELRASGFKVKRVEVTARINKNIFIPKDSTGSITAAGLLSEKYLEISPGNYDAGQATVADVMTGRDPISLDQMLADTQATVKTLDDSLKNISVITAQVNQDLPGIITGLDKLIGNADKLTTQADGLVGKANGVIGNNEQNLRDLLKNLENASVNLKYLSRMLAERPWKMLLPAFPNQVPSDSTPVDKNQVKSGSIPKR